MNWESRYVPPSSSLWQGRADIPSDSCFYQHVRLLDLLSSAPEKSAPITFAMIGFKCDEGIQRDLGRAGAVEGPDAIRYELAKLPIQKQNVHFYDAGNIVCEDHDLETSQQALSDVVSLLLAKGIKPIVVGGGHELAWGHYQGIIKTDSDKNLGIINFDAHFDLHPLYPSGRGGSSTAFYQIALAHLALKKRFDYNCIGVQHAGDIRQSFDIAKKLNVRFILADDLHQGLQEKCFDFVDRIIDENDQVYVSLSLDVFSAPFAPGVSSIQPLGLNPWHIIPLLRQVASSSKVISYDIAEHVPRYDVDHRTAKLAASMIYEIFHHHIEPKK